jgi:serine/threonine protein kinase
MFPRLVSSFEKRNLPSSIFDPRPPPKPARDFIQRCLTIDPSHRLTTAQALSHPWLRSDLQHGVPDPTSPSEMRDLLPGIRRGFNAKGAWKKAFGAVKFQNIISAAAAERRNSLNGLNEEEKLMVKKVEEAKLEAEKVDMF